MSDVSVFAMYLPQYHETEENSKFWGKGFTDWISVKNANPLFEGHKQPQIPLNYNYYDLSNVENIRWQAKLAKEYGVSGWGIYHYWFNSNQKTLTKPAEIILENSDIEMPFFFAWDNASWKRTWSKLKGNDWSPVNDEKKIDEKNGPEILIEYQLGNREDWKKHFDYLMCYFKDERYIKHDGKPLFLVYNYSNEILEMVNYWNNLAISNGFKGIEVVFSYNPFHGIPQNVNKFRYEPLFSGWGSNFDRFKRLIYRNKIQHKIKIYDYEKVWKKIVSSAKKCKDSKMYYGAFVGYDDSPRRGNKGKVIINPSPSIFGEYLQRLLDICEKQNKPYIFLTAWNEWGEGAHLEPDMINKMDYLEELKKVTNC